MSSSTYQRIALDAARSGGTACWARRDGNRPTHRARAV
ncbi:MAG: hypothetical protein AVDCRST_MAG13-532 [uncultured Solirubrobacteraceae bacterium]|uniref:Uncharacterized protein n=1 Tax=uncultured Solirubrobacteraceae bacterium TaxID=1162706 RepID=A0A6J4REX1_9ACTN|nr:MAG: hypothetical protein AVDCRST_MAG13-532 [uncultured Solirubrobacteraceae bacterium]